MATPRRSLDDIFGGTRRRSLDDIFAPPPSTFNPFETLEERRRREMEALGAKPAEDVTLERPGFLERMAERQVDVELQPTTLERGLTAFKHTGGGMPGLRPGLKGILKTGEGLLGFGQLVGGAIHPRIEQLLEKPKKGLEFVREEITKEREKQDIFGRVGSVAEARGPEEVVESLAQVPMIILEEIPQFVLTGAAGKAGPLASYGAAFLQEAGHAYLEEKEKGGDETSARITAAAVGTANAFLERLAPDSALRGAPIPLVQRLFRQVLTEGGTEGVQEATQMLGSMARGLTDGRYQDWEDAEKKEWNWRRIGAAAVTGGLVGGAAGISGQSPKQSPIAQAQQAVPMEPPPPPPSPLYRSMKPPEGAYRGEEGAAPLDLRIEDDETTAAARQRYTRAVLDEMGPGDPGLQVVPAPDEYSLSAMVFRDKQGQPVVAMDWDPDDRQVANLAMDQGHPEQRRAFISMLIEAQRQNLVRPDLRTMTEDSRRVFEKLEGGLGERILRRYAQDEVVAADDTAVEDPGGPPPATPDAYAAETSMGDRPPGDTPPPPPPRDDEFHREFHDRYVGTRSKRKLGVKALLRKVNVELFNEAADIEINRPMTLALNERYGKHQLALNPVKEGVWRRRTGEDLATKGEGYDPVARGLSQILEDQDVEAVETLLLAREDIENASEGLPGTHVEESQRALRSLRQSFGVEGMVNLQKVADEWQDWMKAAWLDPALETELITQEDYDRITTKVDPVTGETTPRRFYAPMVKLIQDIEAEGTNLSLDSGQADVLTRPEGSAPAASPRPRRRRTSLADGVLSPLEVSIERSAAMARFRAEMNVRRTFISAARENPNLDPLVQRVGQEVEPVFVTKEELGPEATEGKTIFRPKKGQPPGTFMVYEDGKRVFYTAPPAMLEALGALGPGEIRSAVRFILGPVGKILGPLTRLKRSGITLPIEFVGKNLWRDQLEAFVYSPGLTSSYIPVLSFVEAALEMANAGDYMIEFMASGTGDSTFVSPDKESLQKHFARITGDSKTDWTNYANVVKHMRRLSDSVEQITRLGVYTRARESGMGIDEASQAARDATIDFRRGGSTSKEVNKVTAFFNATMRGMEKLYRYHFDDLVVKGMIQGDQAALERGTNATIKAGVAITLPTFLLWLMNHDDEDYQQIPQWEKDYFWHFKKVKSETFGKIPGAGLLFRKVEGRDEYWLRAPKPHGIGWIFGSIPERVLNGLYKDRSDSALQLVKEFWKSQWPSLSPDVLQTFFETRSGEGGWSYFFQRPIEPYGTEGLVPEARFSHRTPEAVKAMAGAFNRLNEAAGGDPYDPILFEELLSPAKLDHVVYSFTGTLGRLALSTADQIGATFGMLPEPPLPIEPSNVHLLKGFVSNIPTGSRTQASDDFYELSIRIDKAGAAVSKAQREGRFEDAERLQKLHPNFVLATEARRMRNDISDIRQRWRTAMNDPTLTPTQRAGILLSLDEMHKALAMHYVEVLRQQSELLEQGAAP